MANTAQNQMLQPPFAELEPEVSNPVKRIRWATHRATGTTAENKRHSLKERLHRRIGSNEKRDSLGKEGLDSFKSPGSSEADGEQEDSGRKVYFNVPLPRSARDDDGHPLESYARNKIRTAKYTPISFIPKNLWFQFHNIANIYFLFIIILGVRIPSSPQAWLAKTLTTHGIDLQHIRSLRTRPQCRSFDCHHRRDWNQGCSRRLAEDNLGCQSQQCARAQASRFQQRQHS
jgi:hypothetical protein